MAQLTLFAIAFTVIVAFSEVSAYKATITTTTQEENYIGIGVDGLITTTQEENFLGAGVDGLITTTQEENFIGIGVDGLDYNPSRSSQKKQCRREILGQELNHCQMHLTQGTSFPTQQNLQQCCNQLKQVEEQCQCEAIQKVIQQAQRQQQQGGRRGTPGRRQYGQQQQMEQMLRKAQMLPNQCRLEIQQCRIPIRIPNEV